MPAVPAPQVVTPSDNMTIAKGGGGFTAPPESRNAKAATAPSAFATMKRDGAANADNERSFDSATNQAPAASVQKYYRKGASVFDESPPTLNARVDENQQGRRRTAERPEKDKQTEEMKLQQFLSQYAANTQVQNSVQTPGNIQGYARNAPYSATQQASNASGNAYRSNSMQSNYLNQYLPLNNYMNLKEQRRAELLVVPSRDVPNAEVTVTLSQGLRFYDQNYSGGSRVLWRGTARASEPIQIPIGIATTAPGNQELTVTLMQNSQPVQTERLPVDVLVQSR